MTLPPLLLDGNTLTLEQIDEVSTHGRKVGLSPEARARVEAARALVDKVAAAELESDLKILLGDARSAR